MRAQSKPRYQQLKESIIARISNGELQPRDRVPSEHELVDSAGVSRMTANRALRELNNEGYVERVAGVGTFVADLKATSHALKVRNIADEIRLRGHQHTAVVLKRETCRASKAIAELLQIEAGSEVHHASVIHFESDVPLQFEDRYVIRDFAPDFLAQDFSLVTPSAYLSGIAPLQEAEHVVRASMPGKDVRDYFKMKNEEPCLVVTRRTWVQGRPVSFARLHHPGSRFELTGHYVPPGTENSNQQHTDIVELRNIDQ
jgi:GntR family transcriptional regulator, histidine utilization repressor